VRQNKKRRRTLRRLALIVKQGDGKLPNRVLAVGHAREDAGFEHFSNRLLG